ncbi:CYTH and CHAD domain-containing protein [Nocardioides sp. SOB77]|uniref:CYTH and CHAD domain-containing protein n=1 Tax=Nocardioides oceani TaxID=3058369 RepID=A0ABT8FK37_9ACTN|nr:CYTH and CHAD domain-containing protein [Nocardioides oceani]MDN4175056.1 CYTH and CHAD domain-containing protein [Nocardioides oceani]
MPRTHLEVEHTYAPPPDAEPPVLAGEGGLPGVARVTEPVVHELHATYHDTGGLDLTTAGVTLRARSGGPDEGWHLKLPAPGGRDEVHHRLGRGETVPARLRELVVPWTRGVALAPVATVTTRRTVRHLVAEDGTVLAELADDEVVGTPAGGRPVTWREWELELVEGDEDLLAAADELFAAHGAPVRPLARKIVATLGERLPTLPEVEDPVLRAVAADVGRLKVLDSGLRRGQPVSAELATVVRRLRAALWVLRPTWGRPVTDPVRAELAWLAEPLVETAAVAAARERVLAALEDEREAVAPVRRLVRETLGEREEEHAARTLELLREDRYLALLRSLDRLVTEPPTEDVPTRKQLRRRLDKAERRAAAQTRKDEESFDVERLHRAMVRVEDVATLVRPVVGKDAKRACRRAEVAGVLGDGLTRARAQQEVRELARAAATTGEAFLLGRVHARLEVRLAG